MNEEAEIFRIYHTTLYLAIGLTAIFERECSLMGLMILVVFGLILIVNLM